MRARTMRISITSLTLLIFLVVVPVRAVEGQFIDTGIRANEFASVVWGDKTYYCYTSEDKKKLVLGTVYEDGSVTSTVVYSTDTNTLAAPAIDVAGDGTVHVSFAENLGASKLVRYARVTPAGTAEVVHAWAANQVPSSLRVDANGVVHLAFVSNSKVRYTNSNDFSSYTTLPTPNAGAFYNKPALKITPQGLLAGYLSDDGTKRHTLVCRQVEGVFQEIANINEGVKAVEQVEVDGDASRVFFATDYAPTTNNVVNLRCWENGSISDWENVLVGIGAAHDSSFFMDDQGGAHLLYWDGYTQDFNLYSRYQAREINNTISDGVYQSVSRLEATTEDGKIYFAFLDDSLRLIRGIMPLPVHLVASPAPGNPQNKPVRGDLEAETVASFNLQARDAEVTVGGLDFSLNQVDNLVYAQLYQGNSLLQQINVSNSSLAFRNLNLALAPGTTTGLTLRLTSSIPLIDGSSVQATLAGVTANGYVRLEDTRGSLLVDNTAPVFTQDTRAGENSGEVVLTIYASETLSSPPVITVAGVPAVHRSLADTSWQVMLDLNAYPGDTVAVHVYGQDLATNQGELSFHINKREYIRAEQPGDEPPPGDGGSSDGDGGKHGSSASDGPTIAYSDGQEIPLDANRELVLLVPENIRRVTVTDTAADFLLFNPPAGSAPAKGDGGKLLRIRAVRPEANQRVTLACGYCVEKSPGLQVEAIFREPPEGQVFYYPVSRNNQPHGARAASTSFLQAGNWKVTPLLRCLGATGTYLEVAGDGIYAAGVLPYPFSDGQDHWARHHASLLWINGVIEGEPGGQVRLDEPITRAELCTLLQHALQASGAGLSAVKPVGFKDIPQDTWYYGPVTRLAGQGWVSGFPDGSFRPRENVTREQAAVLFASALVPAGIDIRAKKSPFVDQREISEWAKAGVERCVQMGIIRGRPNGIFAPTAPLSRAEAFTLVNSALGISVKQ
ncbi:MAG: S-layer homology domain-containing protein [Syntrophomonadaceae bacterium]|nr:S-layer homology domain-containing protein [Syntrophomonadaceae bacterium]